MAEKRRKNLALRIFGWLIFLGLLASPLAFYFSREQEVAVTAAQLGRGHVEQTVTAMASGTVKPKFESMVSGATIGIVMDIPVKEGDRVKKGDLLVELDHAELDSQVALAEANLRVGKSRLEQAKIAAGIYEEIAQTRVSQASAQLELAKLDFNRIKSLTDKKAVSQSDFDKISLAYRVAQETNAAAKASQQENAVRKEEIRSAEAAIEQLEAAVTLAMSMRDKAYVRAPFDGVVAKVYVHLGEVVGSGLGNGLGGGGFSGGGGAGNIGAGGASSALSAASGLSMSTSTALVQLVQDEDLYIKAPFDEANINQIKAGQKARINLDAYRGVDFPATVDIISPTVTRNADMTRTLDIDVRIDDGRDKFVVGMSADVIIVAAEKDNVLRVPSEALIREEEAYVVENGRAAKRKVKIGVGNWQFKEITEGLSEGETFITSVSLKELKPGVRVHVVDSLDNIKN
jgi:HlyD family secretion protein